MRKILVTTALPYANGSIHLGHILEHIQADIWVRFHKMQKHQCYYICADDSHGTSIMLSAEKLGIHPEELIKNVKKEHLEDFKGFYINYDNYHTTHSKENKELVELFYKELKQNNKIYSKNIEQLFDPEKNIFLPDRFIKGSCPNCKAEDQYGDSCEVCGATYNPTELINPYSTISGAKPIIRESKHFFFKLTDCQDFLSSWVNGSSVLTNNNKQQHLQAQVVNKMQEWLTKGLQDWDISRDSPYFGFQIPEEKDKYFYVWMDAPIGYFASFKNYCVKYNLNYDDFFNDKKSEMYHFIGKDILYFHSLFWPAILNSISLKTPTAIFAHGFLTLNSQKMSKSKGTFITARSYLDLGLNPEWLRYYFASKLNSHIEDIDINLKDFVTKVNSDLIGKYVNIISRSLGFIHKKFDGILIQVTTSNLLTSLQDKADSIAFLYENREYSKAIKEIMLLTDIVNSYIDEEKPWILAKDSENDKKLHQLCSVLINAFKILTIYLSPVLPNISNKVSILLNQKSFIWEDVKSYLPAIKINHYEHLITRIEEKMIDDLIIKNKESINKSLDNSKSLPLNFEPLLTEKCSFDDFLKIDMRVAKVLNCEKVEGSEKLLKFSLDIGFENRIIFSGVAKYYPNPEKLIGKLVIAIVNFPPRKMAKFGISQGMILSAADNNELFLLETDTNAKPGMRIG